MVGDRLSTDKKLAENAGIDFILVLSAARHNADLAGLERQPTLVLDDLRRRTCLQSRGLAMQELGTYELTLIPGAATPVALGRPHGAHRRHTYPEIHRALPRALRSPHHRPDHRGRRGDRAAEPARRRRSPFGACRGRRDPGRAGRPISADVGSALIAALLAQFKALWSVLMFVGRCRHIEYGSFNLSTRN